MTEAGYRKIALGFDGAEERSHMGHPDFRVGGRLFATLHGAFTIFVNWNDARSASRRRPRLGGPPGW